MKTRFVYIVMLIASFVWSSCEKHNFAEGTQSPVTSIEELRALHKGADVSINTADLNEAHQITGVVISDAEGSNIPSGLIVLQNTWRNKTRGIVITSSVAGSYKSGDSLLVSIDGGVLKRVNGSLQLTGIADAAIKKISSGNPTNIQAASSYSINLKPNDYESTLVQVKSAVVSPAPLPGSTLSGDKSIINGADSIVLHTEATAAFADTELPASASFAGVLFLTQSATGTIVPQVWPRSAADITDQVAPVDPNGPGLGKFPVLITGFVNDAKGGDGNYEYFQFLATKDIDFEKTPMAVVTCTNAGSAAPYAGTAPAGGWATGGGRTYKFNLTTGKVSKGEFFYVGGKNKKINGPNSTDISASTWISALDYVNNDGDGFGTKSGGLLPNSGNAGGIAIFEGINVTETSIPVDAVFFGGTGKTTIYNEANNAGYRIPENDHYSLVDPATNVAQPFFYQGTNQYVIPHQSPADLGMFVKLGGVFNATTASWTTPRAHVFYLMTMTSAVTEIETGDVTQIAN